jgi:hypothetical protein
VVAGTRRRSAPSADTPTSESPSHRRPPCTWYQRRRPAPAAAAAQAPGAQQQSGSTHRCEHAYEDRANEAVGVADDAVHQQRESEGEHRQPLHRNDQRGQGQGRRTGTCLHPASLPTARWVPERRYLESRPGARHGRSRQGAIFTVAGRGLLNGRTPAGGAALLICRSKE